jgi:Zn-finger nucleic acid-binding protein
MQCPVCKTALRDFHGRLVCDACSGMMLATDDLGRAIEEESGGIEPTIHFIDHGRGDRSCPRCTVVMLPCRLDIAISNRHPKLETKLDRCPEHGVWFDANELASVFTLLRRATEPPSHATLFEILETYFANWGHVAVPRKPWLKGPWQER